MTPSKHANTTCGTVEVVVLLLMFMCVCVCVFVCVCVCVYKDSVVLGGGVVTGTDRGVDVVVFELLIVVESTGVCWTHQGKRHYYVRRKGGMCHSQIYEGMQSRARII